MSWRQPIFRHRRWGATSIRYSGSQTVRGLILVGDVSGKGLKAAMTGALAIGALRTLAAEMVSPAMLLTRLNQQMVAAQQGGFITCLCASVAADGKIVFANAGHLLPYRNGEEVQLEGSLPLGIREGETYEQTTLELDPGIGSRC